MINQTSEKEHKYQTEYNMCLPPLCYTEESPTEKKIPRKNQITEKDLVAEYLIPRYSSSIGIVYMLGT